MTTKNTSNVLLGALKDMHRNDEYLKEMPYLSKSGMKGRIDFLAISNGARSGHEVIAYEVKSSRADFKRDTFEKQLGSRLYANRLYFVTMPGLLYPDEIPPEAGLLEMHRKKFGQANYYEAKVIVKAPFRENDQLPWGMIGPIVRNVRKRHEKEITQLVAENSALREEIGGLRNVKLAS